VFTQAIKAVYEYRGFVSTFAGDAFTAVFPTDQASIQDALSVAIRIRKLFQIEGLQQIKSQYTINELDPRHFNGIDDKIPVYQLIQPITTDEDNKPDTLADRMLIFNFLETYHVRLNEMIRRLIGKKGAI